MKNVFDDLKSKASKKNIPLLAIFELTQRCNLSCAHCYLVPDLNRNELSNREIKTILNDLAESGCLFLTFTGGEIFTRNDTFDILEHACKLGFVTTLFTNGTLLDGKSAEKLKKFNIWSVDISLYSAFPDIHDNITGVEGSWEKAVSSIKLLKSCGISVRIKCPVMRLNVNDINELLKLAEELKVIIAVDPTIAPLNNGKKDNLKLRINKKNLKNVFADSRIYQFPDCEEVSFSEKNVLCEAGKNLCCISAYGDVYPCLQLVLKAGNVLEQSFINIWKKSKVFKEVRGISINKLDQCKVCDVKQFCNRCPGLAHLEDGDLYGVSSVACEMANIKRDLSGSLKAEKFKGLKV